MTAPESLPAVLTTVEVAQLYRCSEWTIRRMAKTGQLPVLKLGRVLRFSRAVVLELLDGARSIESDP